MRCLCCNKNLNDAESTARHPDRHDFLDMCFRCCDDVGITPLVREDFDTTEELDQEYWDSEEFVLERDDDE